MMFGLLAAGIDRTFLQCPPGGTGQVHQRSSRYRPDGNIPAEG
jgi:hypothetical protein